MTPGNRVDASEARPTTNGLPLTTHEQTPHSCLRPFRYRFFTGGVGSRFIRIYVSRSIALRLVLCRFAPSVNVNVSSFRLEYAKRFRYTHYRKFPGFFFFSRFAYDTEPYRRAKRFRFTTRRRTNTPGTLRIIVQQLLSVSIAQTQTYKNSFDH